MSNDHPLWREELLNALSNLEGHTSKVRRAYALAVLEPQYVDDLYQTFVDAMLQLEGEMGAPPQEPLSVRAVRSALQFVVRIQNLLHGAGHAHS